MKINKLSLPHPVLGLNDDVAGDYTAETDVKMGDTKTTINTTHRVTNKTIETMLAKGDIKFCVDVNCPKTLFRQPYLTNELKQTIEIDTECLRDKVLVNFYILATKNISDYSPIGANPDYEGQNFSINAGDVLGYGGETQFFASKTWEGGRNISSFLIIQSSDCKKGPYVINLNGDKIIITLNQTDYTNFRMISESNFDDIFLTSIVLPVLIYALGQMRENENLYGDFSWYQLLDFRIKNDKELKALDLQPEDIPKIAQILLADPLGRTLTRLNSFIENSLDVE